MEEWETYDYGNGSESVFGSDEDDGHQDHNGAGGDDGHC